MWYTEAEIMGSYNRAADKRQQIRILAELNAVHVSRIEQIVLGKVITKSNKNTRKPKIHGATADKALAMLKDTNNTIAHIAKELDCSYYTVYQYYIQNKHKLPLRAAGNPKMTRVDYQRIHKLLCNTNLTLTDVATIANTSYSTVRKYYAKNSDVLPYRVKGAH